MRKKGRSYRFDTAHMKFKRTMAYLSFFKKHKLGMERVYFGKQFAVLYTHSIKTLYFLLIFPFIDKLTKILKYLCKFTNTGEGRVEIVIYRKERP